MATFSREQSGTATISSGTSSTTASITAVTLANSWVKFTIRQAPGTDNPSTQNVRGRINSTTQLTFEIESNATADITIEWHVLEFSSGVTVQRGSLTSTGTTTNQTISAVTLSKAWSIGSSETNDEFTYLCTHKITTTTNLAMYIAYWESGLNTILDWQVIEYDNASVQAFSNAMRNATTDSQTITSVTTSKTLLYGTQTGYEDPYPENKRWRMYLDNATTVGYDRYSAWNYDLNSELYVVSITDDISVQRGEISLSTAQTSNTAAITAVTLANAIICITGGFYCVVSTNYSTDGRPDGNYFTSKFNSTTQIEVQRGATLSAASIVPWEVCEWPGAPAAPAYSWNATMP